jgi:hypothetical protein
MASGSSYIALAWSKSRPRGTYELKLGSEVIGSIRNTSFLSRTALAISSEGRWIFRRVSWLVSRIEIVDSAFGNVIALFKPNWLGGGTLRFCDGSIFRLSSKGCWRPIWNVSNEAGQILLRIETRSKEVQLLSCRTFEEFGRTKKRLTLLTMFAWYRVVQTADDAALTAAIGAAAAGAS